MSTHNAYIKSDEVTLAASRLAQDEAMELGKNFYDAAVRDAVRELCYDTNFDERHIELVIPDDRIITLPAPMGDAINIFAFNGDNCTIANSREVHLKPNYSHHGHDGFFANNKGGWGEEDWFWSDVYLSGYAWDYLYAGIIMDKLYVSPACKSLYSKLRIEYVGMGSDDECTMPRIPMWAREAIMYKAAHMACIVQMSKNAQLFASLANRYDVELKGTRGAWVTAMMRYKGLSPKERRDVNLYNTTFGRH